MGTVTKGQCGESLCDAIVLNFDCINVDIMVVILYYSFENNVICGEAFPVISQLFLIKRF